MRTAVTAALFGVAAVAAGCSDSDDGAPDFAEEFSVRGALAEIPLPEVPLVDESDGIVTAQMADIVTAAELAGVERPDGIYAEPRDYVYMLSNLDVDEGAAPVVVPRMELVKQGLTGSGAEDYESELGWTPLDIDTVVEVWTFPTNRFSVMTTGIDVDEVAERAGEDGVVDVGVAEDGEVLVSDRSGLRVTGEAYRVAPDADRAMIALSLDRPSVIAWLDGGGEEGTWADVDDLAAVASRLDERGVYSAIVSHGNFAAADRYWPPEVLEPILEASGASDLDGLLELYPISEPFTAVGVGWFGGGDDLRVSIVYAFADDAAAEAMVEPLRALYESDEPYPNTEVPIGDLLVVTEVVGEGRTVEVVLDPEPDVFSEGVVTTLLLSNGYWLLHR